MEILRYFPEFTKKNTHLEAISNICKILDIRLTKLEEK